MDRELLAEGERGEQEVRPVDGVTVVELVGVLLLIAILVAMAVPTFLGARLRAQDAVAKTSLRTALSATEIANLYTAGV